MRQTHHQNQYTLQRSTSTGPITIAITTRSTGRIDPSNHRAAVPSSLGDRQVSYILLRRDNSTSITSPSNDVSYHHPISRNAHSKLSSLFRSFFGLFSFPITLPTCKWLTIPSHISTTPSLGRKVTGTLFGHRRGHVSFSVQLDPRSEPILLLELAMSTSSLVKEMSSGLVRLALECEKPSLPSVQATSWRTRKLCQEKTWNMYCNGRNCGYAVARTCGDMDRHVLRTVQAVSVGAGAIPLVEDGRKGSSASELGELLYMRARFERVVGSRHSEAFYMLNPDGNGGAGGPGGPELGIYLLRV